MKKIILLSIAIFSLNACKEANQVKTIKSNIPLAITKVLDKHGGLNNWRALRQLSFTKGNEVHTIDLHSRKSLITAENYTIGNNGKDVWLQQKDSTSFRGNKDFYHNLFFYFYAMPFVLADNGINYQESKPLHFENNVYPGFKISFKANIGTSPDDNYYIYYNPKTFQMEWLQYSVTYFSKKPTTKVNTIRYNDWKNVDGFLLPNSITWYKKDSEGKISEPSRLPVFFTNPKVSKVKLDDNIFNQVSE